MRAEFFEAGQNGEPSAAIGLGQFRGERRQPAGAEDGDEAVGLLLRQQADAGGVEGVEGDADGDGVAVGQAVFRQQLQLVGRPMAVVQRARGAEFVGIARRGDVVEVQQGAALEDAPDGRQIALVDFPGGPLDQPEEVGILDGGDFDGFGDAIEQQRQRQRREEIGVVQDGPGRGERAQQVLRAGVVDGVLDPDAGIALGEGGGGHAHEAHAAVEQRGRQAGGVEERAAADRDAERMAANVPGAQRREHPADGRGRLLDVLTARQDQRGPHQLQRLGVGFEIGADLLRQAGQGGLDALVQQDEAPVAAGNAAARQRVPQRAVARREQMPGERDGKVVADDDALHVDGHGSGFPL